MLEAQGLVALCGDLTTATNINRALAQVFLLTAQGRISQKQAVAFGYLSQLLLQTVPGIRSEFVSVHGYKSWENKLKTSLMQNTDEAPDPSSGGHNDGGPSVSAPVTSEISNIQSPAASSASRAQEKSAPDYTSIYHRSLDLLDRKYDTTPEGRREANILLLELELMNPAPAKPRRDFFGQTVELVRRIRDNRKRKSADAINPFQKPSTPVIPDTPAPQETTVAEQSAPSVAPEPVFCSSGRPAEALMSEQGVRPEAFSPSASDSRRPSTHGPQSSGPGLGSAGMPEPGTAVPAAPPRSPLAPIPGFTLRRAGHSRDWYAPASWSRPLFDPFPSRQEQLKRKLRGNMSDRRWQHQNQCRAFWH